MKFKKYLFIILLVFVFLFTFYNYTLYKKNINSLLANTEHAYNDCKDIINNEQDYINNPNYEEYKQYCYNVINDYEKYLNCKNNKNNKECKKYVKSFENENKSTKEIFTDLISNTNISLYFCIFTFLIIFCCSYEISIYTNKLIYKNYLTRMSYNKFILLMYKQLLKYIVILPIFTILNLLFSVILSSNIDLSFIFNLRFISLYFINLILQSIFYINIVFICMNGSKNFIITFSKSCGLYMVTVFLGQSLDMIFKKFNIIINNINVDIFDLFNYTSEINYLNIIMFSIFLILITSLILIITTRNKEKVLHNMERGEISNDY